MLEKRIEEFDKNNKRRIAQYKAHIERKCAVYNQATQDTEKLYIKKYANQNKKIKSFKKFQAESRRMYREKQERSLAKFKRQREAALQAFIQLRYK